MDQAAFLKSPMSGKHFVGSRSDQRSLSRRLKQLDVGTLNAIPHKRLRKREFGDIEDRLISYINLRGEKYKINKCGINWMTLRNKSQEHTEELGYSPRAFRVSSGWISRVLSRHNKVGITLHGEADDMTVEEREDLMSDWHITFHDLGGI